MAFELNPKVQPSGSGKALYVRSYPEAASQTFKAGELVTLSSGAVAAAAATGSVLGIALKDASGTAGTSIPVHVITPEDLVRIRVYNGTSIVSSDNATLGASYGFSTVSNSSVLDTSDITNAVFVVEDQEQDSGGAYTNWAYVRLSSAKAVIGG